MCSVAPARGLHPPSSGPWREAWEAGRPFKPHATDEKTESQRGKGPARVGESTRSSKVSSVFACPCRTGSRHSMGASPRPCSEQGYGSPGTQSHMGQSRDL